MKRKREQRITRWNENRPQRMPGKCPNGVIILDNHGAVETYSSIRGKKCKRR